MRMPHFISVLLAACCLSPGLRAAEVQVAVASNFAAPFARISEAFRADTGHVARSALGATGKFYAQIKAGAPFEVLLAADDEVPRRLLAEGLGVAGSSFTYARGKLVLWSAAPGVVDEQGAVLRRSDIARLAVCDPKLAPYGRAAEQSLRALGLYASWAPRFVMAENVSQAYQFVATENATLGLLALSQIQQPGKAVAGSYWLVPSNLYEPIVQDALLLKRGEQNPAARALLEYLRSDKVRALIKAYGYDL